MRVADVSGPLFSAGGPVRVGRHGDGRVHEEPVEGAHEVTGRPLATIIGSKLAFSRIDKED